MKQNYEIIKAGENYDPERVGGKGSQLQVLRNMGLEVPPFYIISTAAFEHYKVSGALPDGLVDNILSLVAKWAVPWVSVRSSVNCEDGRTDSFAGVFDSYLHVSLNQIEEKILQVFQSLTSERVESYRQQKKITTKLSMAVVIQKMIFAESAGVAFSRAPLPPTADMIIEGSWGLGEGVVSGKVAVDHWRYSRLGEVLEEEIKNKETEWLQHPEGGLQESPVPEERRTKPVLNVSQREELLKNMFELEKNLGHPVDVEWAYYENKFYFLQVRPITRQFPPLASYVDTNLAESYPGVSSPFTASYVKLAYRNVFMESAVLLGANSAKLAKLMPHFESLIGEAGHHLYYHLEHYYAVLGSMPGGGKNIENWHRMIGGKMENAQVEIRSQSAGLWETIVGIGKFLAFTLTLDRIMERFCSSLEAHEVHIQQRFADAKDAKKSIETLTSVIQRPLGFGLTLLNDALIMGSLRPLAKILKKHDLDESLLSGILKTDAHLDSLLPLEHLQRVVGQLSKDFWLAWTKAIENVDEWDGYTQVWEKLNQGGWKQETEALQGFLREFGERSFEELKLESPTFRQSPEAFNQVLSLLREDSVQYSDHGLSQNKLSIQALSLKEKLVWRLFSGLARKAIFWREKTRLFRGKFYNLIRVGLLQVAEQMRAEHAEFKEFERKDFYSITLQEYQAFARGEINKIEIIQLMKERSDWKSLKREYPEFLVIGVGESPFKSTVKLSHTEGTLMGRCASGGVVEGIPLVVDTPADAFNRKDLSDCILVTKHTDPAWVYIMARCKGLISEKGSLLSHTAIIGREMGLPTVVGVKNATKLLANIERITLNGDTGEVIIHGG